MSTAISREQLQKHIERLPDDIVQQIADFTFFVMAQHNIDPLYADWTIDQWQNFSLEPFFRERDDEVEYTLDDAQEVYHP